MPRTQKPVRQSVTLPPEVAKSVREIARASDASTSRVLVDLIRAGLEAREQEKQRFLELADRLARSRNREEQAKLKAELARMTFGD